MPNFDLRQIQNDEPLYFQIQNQCLMINPISGTSRNKITINRTPLRTANTLNVLIYEWALLGYYISLLSSVLTPDRSNIRVVAYGAVFFLFEALQTTHKYIEIEDPLHLTAITRTIRRLSLVCIANLVCLLLRIILETHNLHSLLLFFHFLVTISFFFHDFSKKGSKAEIGIDKTSVSRVLTPLLLFAFSSTINSDISNVSLIQLALLTANLFASVEVRKILCLRESYFFGWANFQENGKAHMSWSRKRALRSIIVGCCILIVTQNLFLIFESIKYEVGVTIVHTFIVSITAYVLYRDHPKS